jgi:hypothetical protein
MYISMIYININIYHNHIVTSMVSNIRKNPDRTEKLGITLPVSLLHKIDNNRGDIPRSKYIRRAIERYLK